jgi:hypothetical protein
MRRLRRPALALLSGVPGPSRPPRSARLPAVWTAARGLDRDMRRLPTLGHRVVPIGIPLRGARSSRSHAAQVLRSLAGGPGVRALDGGNPGRGASGVLGSRAGRGIRPDMGAARGAAQARSGIRPGRGARSGRWVSRGVAGAGDAPAGGGDCSSGPPSRDGAAQCVAGSLRCGRAGGSDASGTGRRRAHQRSNGRRMRKRSAQSRCLGGWRAYSGEIRGRGRTGPLL